MPEAHGVDVGRVGHCPPVGSALVSLHTHCRPFQCCPAGQVVTGGRNVGHCPPVGGALVSLHRHCRPFQCCPAGQVGVGVVVGVGVGDRDGVH
jgi:hypothetical protein